MCPPILMSVVVVSFNTREALTSCLQSVLAASPAETIVVDNGSTDGSIETVRDHFSCCRLIVTERNVGYGAAANQGIAACNTSSVVLLNGDTVLSPDALEALGRYLAERPRVAVVGPRLVNPDGSLQRSTYPYPSPLEIFFGETGLHLLVRAVPVLRERFLRTWSHDRPRRVSWVLGAALGIRRSAFQAVGGFDPEFFMYGEEVDLCRRLEASGFETHYAPVTTVMHLGGASTATRAEAMRRELILSRNRYMRRYRRPGSAARSLFALRALLALKLIRDTVLCITTRDRARRNTLRATVTDGFALLAERELWSP